MILGVLVGAVGTGLLIRIGLDTTTIQWATYLVIAGLGTGIGMQQPFSALHVVLRCVLRIPQKVLSTVLIS